MAFQAGAVEGALCSIGAGIQPALDIGYDGLVVSGKPARRFPSAPVRGTPRQPPRAWAPDRILYELSAGNGAVSQSRKFSDVVAIGASRRRVLRLARDKVLRWYRTPIVHVADAA